MSEQDPKQAVALSEWRANDDLSLVPLTPNEAKQRREIMIQFIHDAMKEGRDYGVIPGTNERTLWKPGAEKLCTLFGYSFRIIPIETVLDWTGKDHDGEPFFFFRHRCELRHGAVLIGDSEGSCNSWEKKYRWRDGKRKCPKCGKESVYKSKPRENDPPGKPMGFYCWTKQGGCGATFPPNDDSITSQQVGPVKNDGIYDQVNTIQKMSEKRALVGTAVIACNASEFFALDFDEEGTFEVLGDTRPIVTRDDLPQETPEEIEAKLRAASSALRGDQGEGLGPTWEQKPVERTTPQRRVWKGETVQLVIKSGAAASGQEAAALLNKSALSTSDPEDVLLRWIGKYKAGIADGLSQDAAVREANETLPGQ